MDIPRSGKTVLTFSGDMLYDDSAQMGTGRTLTLALYSTLGGSFVIKWEIETTWQGELSKADAEVYTSLAEAGKALETFDIVEFFTESGMGYPADTHYAAKREALHRTVRNTYAHLVKDACVALDIKEVVE